MTPTDTDTNPDGDGAALDALLDEWIAEELAEFPVLASGLGADGDHGALPDLSEGAFERRARRDREWAQRVAEHAENGLGPDRRIDRDLLLAFLAGRAVMEDWQAWRRDPATYLQPCLEGVFVLVLHRLFPEPEWVGYASSRLRSVPALLEAGRANLDANLASPIIVERAVGQCTAAIGYFRELLPAEVSDDRLRAELAAAGEEAAVAAEGFLDFLGELKGSARGSYAIGEERYSGLLEQRELLGYGAEELRHRGRAAWDELAAEMDELAAAVDGDTAGAEGWRSVVESLNALHPESPDAMRAAYASATDKARQFLVDEGLVTLPDGERCLVDPSPPFQRPILAVASYAMPPAFRPGLVGHFFVPYPPDGTSPEEVARRLQSNNFHSIPTIAVHEAYPGHHWQLSWSKGNPRRLRHLLRTSYFAEGWALYAERLMREHGFFADPRDELCHLDARIFRAARIVVDTGLHIGDLDFEEAVEFMRTRASLPEPVARAEVGRYCTWPTQASSYLTGALEIERMRERYLAEGRGDLRQFNDAVAGSGCLPLGLAREALFAG